MYSNRILLVQSNPSAPPAPRLRARLEDKGYAVVDAADAQTAMDIIHRSEIALVVTELYLPVGASRCLARRGGRDPVIAPAGWLGERRRKAATGRLCTRGGWRSGHGWRGGGHG